MASNQLVVSPLRNELEYSAQQKGAYISGPKSERIKKSFQSSFKKYGLEIIIERSKKVVDLLDVTFNQRSNLQAIPKTI